METQLSIKHDILQHSRSQFYPGEDEVSSCKTRRRVWCLAAKSKVIDYRSNASKVTSFSDSQVKSRISAKSAKPSAFSSRRFSRPAKPAKPAKPAVFLIGESIKRKFRVFQVYRSQNWYQSNTTLVILIA